MTRREAARTIRLVRLDDDGSGRGAGVLHERDGLGDEHVAGNGPTPYTMWTNGGNAARRRDRKLRTGEGATALARDTSRRRTSTQTVKQADDLGAQDARAADSQFRPSAVCRAGRSAGRRVCRLYPRVGRPGTRGRSRASASSRGTSSRRMTIAGRVSVLRAAVRLGEDVGHGHGARRCLSDVRPQRRRARRHVQHRHRRCPRRRGGCTTCWSTT